MDVELKSRLEGKAKCLGHDLTSQEFALAMDAEDPLRSFRNLFHFPKRINIPEANGDVTESSRDSVYFSGMSLGLCPTTTKDLVCSSLDDWANLGVHGHTTSIFPWAEADLCVDEQMAALVGAKREEVAVMNGLSVNLHLFLLSFYQPTPSRHKILCESRAFPSDYYIIESQIQHRGFQPATSMICVQPKSGEEWIDEGEILRVIEEEGESIAAILLGGVQYYTGQLFDMAAITAAAQRKGIIVGFDLAHAVGNVPLHLHDWNVDFACWCTYKYLNSGAGGIACAYMHERHNATVKPALQGWWGHKSETRFDMDNEMDLEEGVRGFRLTNPSILMCASLKASLNIYHQTSLEELRNKSIMLTGYLEWLIRHYFSSDSPGFSSQSTIRILTPPQPERRGCQLSLCFSIPLSDIYEKLSLAGVSCDKREPSVIRTAPVHLYNSFEDVYKFVEILRGIL